jgi:hypothetical protein
MYSTSTTLMSNVADECEEDDLREGLMTKRKQRVFWELCGIAALTLIVGCKFPYSPKTQPLPEVKTIDTTQTSSIGSGILYPIDTKQQTCNPSISQNSAFAGCMLWLNLKPISVKVPDSLSGYSVNSVEPHDRLTISDTSNTVRWYMMLSDFNGGSEFQCPEWSTHPDYIACLVGTFLEPYSGYAVRLSDKKFLKICNNKLKEFSEPHFWLPDSALHGGAVAAPVYDTNGFIQRDQVRQFFGTTQFKFVYTLLAGGLFYVDYSASGNPSPIPLQKPEGVEDLLYGSPLISPDGGWVAYHCGFNFAQGEYYQSYIQRLSPDAKPILIADQASDPHWWVNRSGNNQYYIVYSITNGPYSTEYDFSDPSIEKLGGAGATMIQKLKGSWGDVPSFLGGLSPDDAEKPNTLINLPFKGGLSPDGHFLCTAYKYAYLLRLK